MRKRSTATFVVAGLLVIGYVVGDDDSTPATAPSDGAATAGPTLGSDPSPQVSSDHTPTPESVSRSPDSVSESPRASGGRTPTPDAASTPQPAERSGLVEQIESLRVADGDRGGYDRNEFGDYDREALLDASLDEHGCFYSHADDLCYDDAGEVHVDHLVALAEAWRSGLDESDTDAIAGDPDNLWLMTAGLNMSKSDDDPAAWLPPDDGAMCTYLERHVAVKLDYDLSIDAAERDALTEAAANC